MTFYLIKPIPEGCANASARKYAHSALISFLVVIFSVSFITYESINPGKDISHKHFHYFSTIDSNASHTGDAFAADSPSTKVPQLIFAQIEEIPITLDVIYFLEVTSPSFLEPIRYESLSVPI